MRAPNSAPSIFSNVALAAVRFATRLREAGEHRRVVHSLASLDDHMLRDIGLTRFDVASALVEPALTDGTLVLAERARELRQHQRAMALEAQAWATALPDAAVRGTPVLAKRAA